MYDECVSTATSYCSILCQKADWDQHKSRCKKLQARKTLGRVALLLQAIIYRIRLHASPVQFKSLRTEGSIILLEGVQLDGLDPKRQLNPFPDCLDGDQSLSQDNLFAANGMRTLRAIRGLVRCKVTVREVVAIRSGDWRDPKLLFNLYTSDKRRFDNENTREVERVLTLEIPERSTVEGSSRREKS